MPAGRKSGPASTTLALCAAAVTAAVVTPAPAQAAPTLSMESKQPKATLTAHQKHVLHVKHMKYVAAKKRAAAAAKAKGSAKGRKAAAYARRQVGDAYRWGATGPSAFDCSGLTLAAWRQAGVRLPHQARQQSRKGRAVSRSALRPGDLVFFYSARSHVGIYIGGGKMVHAANRRDDVKVDVIARGYWKRQLVAARRIA